MLAFICEWILVKILEKFLLLICNCLSFFLVVLFCKLNVEGFLLRKKGVIKGIKKSFFILELFY